MGQRRVLLHTSGDVRDTIDVADVYYVEARAEDTLVRRRSKRELIDIRRFDLVSAVFERAGFIRIHREYLVNPQKIRQIRRRDVGRDWEVVLDPPVNRVLPIGRDRFAALMAWFDRE